MTLFPDVPLALTPAAAAAASGGEWSAKEELMLLDGIDMYGYGNWRDIASFVGSRTDAQCLRHYTWVYLDPAGPMAVSQRGGSLAASGASGAGFGSSAAQGPASSPSGASSAGAGAASGVGTSGGAAAAAAAAPAPPSSTLLGGAGTPGFPHGHIPRPDPPFAISGYMPLRGDFDIEWDNEAEAALADMDFAEGEHATETELKLRVLEIYCAKLDERERRKRFVLERGLLEHKRLQAVERRRPKEERELYDSLRPFARFASPAEHEDLVRGLILENRLRKRIAQLAEYRRVGLRSLAEAQDYETAKRKGGLAGFFRQREIAAAATAATAAASAAAGSAGSVEIGAAGTGLSAFPHSLQPAGAGVAGLGADPAAVRAAMAQIIGVPIAAAPPVAAVTGGADAATSVPASTAGAVPPAAVNGSTASADASATTGRKRQRPAASSPEASPQALPPPAAAAAPPVVPGFSLAGMPGVDRLTRAEVALCETLALLPYQYLQIKTTILNVAAMKGVVRPRDVSTALLHVGASVCALKAHAATCWSWRARHWLSSVWCHGSPL